MTPQDLKNSILQLAIQGKLVEQRPEEGSAEELYAQIQAEKQALIKAKKIKKEKTLPEISDEEKPFDIPDNWKWVRTGEILQLLDGEKLQHQKYPYMEAKVLRGKCAAAIHDTGKFAHEGVRVILVDGENSGEVFRLPLDGYMGSTFKLLFMPSVVNAFYIEFFLLFHKADFRNNKRGAAIPHLDKVLFKNTLLPLPPFEEQKRIVEKIEQLLPLIDRYGEAWNQLATFNTRFPDDMQKAILQAAIQGKLVEQRPEEGSAEELYRVNQIRKQELLKSKVLKKPRSLPDITDEEKPFDISDSWKWVRLGDVLVIERGGSPRPIKEYLTTAENGINWIKIGDSDKGGKYINQTREKIIPKGVSRSRFVHKGDFLLSNSMSFGRPYILNIDGCIHDGWLVLHPMTEIFNKDYLYYLLSSAMVFHQFCQRVAGAVVNNLNSDKVAITLVPVPPYAEQKRIVAKIEELLALCRRLKA